MATEHDVLDRLEAMLAADRKDPSREHDEDMVVALIVAAPALIRLARAAAALDACHDLNFAPGWLTKQAACKLEHEAAIKALGEVRL